MAHIDKEIYDSYPCASTKMPGLLRLMAVGNRLTLLILAAVILGLMRYLMLYMVRRVKMENCSPILTVCKSPTLVVQQRSHH